MPVPKFVTQVTELAQQHAEDERARRKRSLTEREAKDLAGEAFWNVVFPLLENRGADTEAKYAGATLETHYIRAFVAAQSGKSPRGSKKPARAQPPVRELQREGDRDGSTLRAVRAYVESGADVNELIDARDVHLESLLFLAAANQHTPIMRYLLEHGADPNLANGDGGERPLQATLEAGDDIEPVALLLKHGADPNAASQDDCTPLHDAIALAQPKIVELLLAHGADPKRVTPNGGTPKPTDAFGICDEFLRRSDGDKTFKRIAKLLAAHRTGTKPAVKRAKKRAPAKRR